jgi:hypothetical protein
MRLPLYLVRALRVLRAAAGRSTSTLRLTKFDHIVVTSSPVIGKRVFELLATYALQASPSFPIWQCAIRGRRIYT